VEFIYPGGIYFIEVLETGLSVAVLRPSEAVALHKLVSALVVMKLSNPVKLEIVKKYFVDGLGPTDISLEVFGGRRGKFIVRHYVLHVYDAVRPYVSVAVAYRLIREVLATAYPVLASIPTAVELGVAGRRCAFCGKAVENVDTHISVKHRDVVEAYVNEILRRCFNGGKAHR